MQAAILESFILRPFHCLKEELLLNGKLAVERRDLSMGYCNCFD